MISIKVFVEIGKKKTFAGAVDWPGWCRRGRDEKMALQALIEYGPRYAQVLDRQEIEFQAPTAAADLIVTERLEGNATTDFGAPATILAADREPLERGEFERLQTIVLAPSSIGQLPVNWDYPCAQRLARWRQGERV